MSARFLDDAARTAFGRAISTIEAASAVEVVLAVRRRSGHYYHANAIVGALVALAGLAVALYAEHPFGYLAILFDPFAIGTIAAALVELLPGVKRLLTPPGYRRERVRKAARATFVERGVHNTRERSGLLVYISWLEQRVVLVPDSGLEATWPEEERTRVEDELTHAMPKGGEAVARRLEEIAASAAKAMPRAHDDVNELPDAIDSDLKRPRRAP